MILSFLDRNLNRSAHQMKKVVQIENKIEMESKKKNEFNIEIYNKIIFILYFILYFIIKKIIFFSSLEKNAYYLSMSFFVYKLYRHLTTVKLCYEVSRK